MIPESVTYNKLPESSSDSLNVTPGSLDTHVVHEHVIHNNHNMMPQRCSKSLM